MLEESNYLFVYGTLLKDFDSYMSKFLNNNSEFIGKGYFHGKLYEVSWYPGAVLSEDVTEKVYGHLFKILNNKKTFKILDDYEGISETAEYSDEYVRVLINTHLETGDQLKSWVYVYNHDISKLKRILSGDYTNMEGCKS